jgi:hypothetical protein
MESQLTDERLRTWLNANQPARERLCLALLGLDERFENAQPRRPEGGPDGARDMEVLFNGIKTWGAVGFRNNANDSPEDKKWAVKKFKDDLAAATSENPNLKSFVFFTNIDLTPGEIKVLSDHAAAQGMEQSDIFYRERLRIWLDSPGGLALRFRYLDIRLSDAEQVSFFERYGADLEQLLLKQFDHVDKRLARIEFFHESAQPLLGIELFVELKREFTPDELAHFRVMIEILNLYESDPHPTLYVAGRDAYGQHRQGDKITRIFGCKSIVWSRNPDESIQSTVFSVGQPSTQSFHAGGHMHKRGPYPTIASMDKKTVWVHVTRPLFEQISSIGLVANGYILTGGNAEDLEFEERNPLSAWLEPLTEKEASVPWVMLRAKREPGSHPMTWPQSWSLDFSRFTPEKYRT